MSYKLKNIYKLALNSGIQTYQILTNDDEVCIPNLSSSLLAVPLLTNSNFFVIFIVFLEQKIARGHT